MNEANKPIDPLWKRRLRLPANRQVAATANALSAILKKFIVSINRESDYFHEIILEGDVEEIDLILSANGWKQFGKSTVGSQIESNYSNPDFPNVRCTHWFGKNGHQIDVESLDGLQ